MLAGLLAVGLASTRGPRLPPMLIAPMVGNLDDCLLQDAVSVKLPSAFRPRPASCNGNDGSAAALLAQTLNPLEPHGGQPFQLGYTLNVPLLRMLQRGASGGWQVDRERVARMVRTLAQTERPAIVYLFATHFGVDAPVEVDLMRDPANVTHTQHGPLPADGYLDYSIYPWSLARTDNGITRARDAVIAEFARQLCAAPEALQRVAGITMLGELHQLFPKFETGMGFESPYEIGDYSDASVRAFRRHLIKQLGDVTELNRRLGSDFARFDDVLPPRLDIRQHTLRNYFEHIDAYAHGTLPVSGWVHVPSAMWQGQAPDSAGDATTLEARKPWVRIVLNGLMVGRVRANLSRQDVAQARPELLSPDLGWRFDLPFDQLAPGTHRIDVMLELPAGGLAALGVRHINVMARDQAQPQPHAMKAELIARPMPEGVAHFLDWPQERQDVYHNPLVPYWHAFRGEQVVRYLQHVQQQVAQTCLAQKPVYVHQLYPHGNPSWDASRYAVARSLQAHSAWRLGISLYGESSYGFELGQRLRQWRQTQYGVTEFHPLRAVSGDEMRRIFALHHQQGARFLSFFMEARPQGSVPQRMHNEFSFDAQNGVKQGAALYEAVRQVMVERVDRVDGVQR